MTASPDKNLRIAITGSLVVHALLFLLLAWMFAGEAARLTEYRTALITAATTGEDRCARGEDSRRKA